MTNTRRSRISATRLAAEGAVVVISILIAFALDAWWAERQLEQEMAEDLAIVEYELAENIRLVNLTMDIMKRVISANEEFIAALKADISEPVVEISDTTLFWGVFSNPTLDPSLGGIDAWIAAGRLAGIESPVLRQRLASVRGKVEDVIEEQSMARQMSVREIYPLLQDGIGDISSIVRIFSEGFHARQATSVQDVPVSSTIAVPNTGALRFMLQARTAWYESSIKETGDFLAELEEIQQLVRDEMGGLESGSARGG